MFSTKTGGTAIAPEQPRSKSEKTMPSIISKELVVRGEFASQGDMQVDGTIEGDVKSVTIRIGDGGAVNGTITADSVLIAGTVTGKIHSKAIVIARTARVQAELWVDSLAIEAGARFEGTCKRFAAESEAGEAKSSPPVRLAVAGGRTGDTYVGEE